MLCFLSMHTLTLHPEFNSHNGPGQLAFVSVVPLLGVELLRLASH